MQKIDIKLTTTADLSGLNQTREGVKQLERDTNRAGSEWDKFTKGLGKKFTTADIGKGILQGIGLGSGAEVIQRAVEAIVAPFRAAAEQAERIAGYTDATTKAIEERLRLRRTDEQQLDILTRKERQLSEQIRRATGEDAARLTKEQAEMQLEIAKLEKAISEKNAAAAERRAEEARRKAEEAKRQADQEAEKIERSRQTIADEEHRQAQLGESLAMKIARLRREIAQLEADADKSTGSGRMAILAEQAKQTTALKSAEAELEARAARVVAQQKAAEFAKLATAEQLKKLRAEDAALQNELADLDQTNAVQKLRSVEIDERRLSLADQIAAATQREAAAREQVLSAQLAAGQLGGGLVSGSQFLTTEQKNRALTAILEQENDVLTERISALEAQNIASPDPARQSQIDALRSQQAGNDASIASMEELNVRDSAVAGLVGYLDSIPTIAQRAQGAILNLAQSLETGIATSLDGLIHRTMTWRGALENIGQAVINSIIGQFVRMTAQWITQQIVMAVFGNAIRAAQLAAIAPVAAATALLWAPAATAASIATMGAAAIEGSIAAKTAIVASVLGFETGGVIPAGERFIRVNENGTEAVLNAQATSMLGRAGVDALNSGTFVPQIAQPAYEPASGGGPQGGARGSRSFDPTVNINVVAVDSRAAARDIERGSLAETKIVEIMQRNRYKIFGRKLT